MNDNITKTCAACGQTKPVEQFSKDKTRKDRYNSRCKPCDNARRDKDKLKQLYDLTPDQYNEMLAKQGGKCYICGRLPKKIRLAVDHNHYTNKVRGLLCGWCNRHLLGTLESRKNRDEILANLQRYIREFGWGEDKS